MTREEILQIAKPILFNTDMVQAILDDRKTATRRISKYISQFDDEGLYFNIFRKGEWMGPISREQAIEEYAPCKAGDILYVRETWSTQQSNACMGNTTKGCPYDSCETASGLCFENEYIYKATDRLDSSVSKWHPSIHMPKEAARIFLRVTDVRVERLQDITEHEAELEGCSSGCIQITGGPWGIEDDPDVWTAKDEFIGLWNSTIKKKDLRKYRWTANPWVWVIEFERYEIS